MSSRYSIMGEQGLERWESQPERRREKRGLGVCNIGSGLPVICCFGGIGCNVDHAWIAYYRRDHMTEGNGEQHTHEETVKDEHTNEDGTVTVEKTETTEAESNGDE